MFKPVVILGVLAVFFICESSCQRPHIILPTYRPPPAPRRPIIMRARRDTIPEPLWLNQGDIPRAPASGDHPFLPTYIDDIKLDPNRRVARSYGTPGGSHRGTGSSQSGSRDTGATHPGSNRRNARSAPDHEPLWLNQGDIPRAPATGDHPFLPKYIDDFKMDPNRRVVRSYGAPGGSHRGTGSSQSGSRDTGATHPGYNRRNARDLTSQPIWPTLPPFNPQLPGPKYPWDTNQKRLPIYV